MTVRDFVSYSSTTHIHRAAVILFIILLAIGMGIGFSIAIEDARASADADLNRRISIFSQWQMDLSAQLTKASSLAATAGAFVMATVDTPTNLSAPSAARMTYLNADAFERLCRKVHFPGVTSMALAPGGVNSQMFPPGSVTKGFDYLNSASYPTLRANVINSSDTYVTGPSKLASRPGYAIFVWFPVHISNVSSLDTFWGMSYVKLEIPDLLAAMNISTKMHSHHMDYIMWYTTNAGITSTIIAESDPAASTTVMDQGMRMTLPISEVGRTSYMAMYPRGGPVSANIKVSTALTIVIATVLGSVMVITFLYLSAYAYFCFRHRQAPASHQPMYIATIALRGAQPIADRAPLSAVKMFNDFTASVRQLAISTGCYPICEIGDRCVYVASKDPARLLQLAQTAVVKISVDGNANAPDDQITNKADNFTTTRTATVTAARTALTSHHMTENMTESSFISAVTCRPSVACHTITTMRVYDVSRDVYFYGSASQLGKLCGALDLAKCGEVCWTDTFESRCVPLCKEAASAALSTHTVSANGESTLHVASWWKECGDERDDEDPSTAMAVLSDAYVRRMTVIVSQGKSEARVTKRNRDGGVGETKSGSSSNRSNEASTLMRSATLLHVAIIQGDEKTALEVVRRIVTEEKGAVVSAHEATIVAAFNLLSLGGHHQIRAADTVMRLREALPNTHFACSIQYGKVGALVMDGLVMCTGEATARGRALLNAAVTLSTTCEGRQNDIMDAVTCFSSDSETRTLAGRAFVPSRKRLSKAVTFSDNGLCLLCCHEDLNSTYDCEAVDVATFSDGKPKVVFRLACKRSGKAPDDEWMYQLKDEENGSPYATVNAIFDRIAKHELHDAARLWRELSTNGTIPGGVAVSSYAKSTIEHYTKNM